MNIFKVLSSGNGSIKEPNISAFLGYLLDPNQEHGLKDFLLKSVISPLIKDNDDVSQLLVNGYIKNLTNESNFRVNVELEKKVKNLNNEDKFIDIVISIYDVTNITEPLFIICIENKIRNEAIQKNQLKEQLEGISKENNNTPIGFIFLTPKKSKTSLEEYKDFEQQNKTIPSYHSFWNDSNEDNANDSIYQLLVTMLEKESKGEMEPIFEYSKYTIKAFLNFIKSNFKSYSEEKSNVYPRNNYNKSIQDYIQDVHSELSEDETYEVKDIKEKISIKVFEDNGFDIDPGTLNCQMYVSTVNSRSRKDFSVTEKNHHRYDLFYYIDDTRKKIRKFPKEGGIEGIEIIFKK